MTFAQHNQGAVGFSRLGYLLPIPAVTPLRGGARAVFSPAELAARLELPGPVDNVVGGKGGSEKATLSPNANARKELQRALAFQEEETVLRSSLPVAREARVDNPETAEPVETERLAHHLATALAGNDGLRHLAFYRKVARMVPRPVVLDALGRAKDAQNIRKSRAHLFAYLVRPYLNNSSRNSQFQ